MDKEKEIQEIAKVLCKDKSEHLSSCKYCGEIDCYFITNAEHLYNAGYRKADEVRSETAREILMPFYNRLLIWGVGVDFEQIKSYLGYYGIKPE